LQPFLGEHALTAFLGWSVSHVHTGTFNLLLAIVATAVGLGAIFVSRGIYGNNKGVVNSQQDTLQTNPVVRPLWNLANARMYWDQFYFAVIENPFNKLSQFLANTIDWDFWHNYFHDSVITKGFNGIGNLLSKPVDLGLIDATVLGFGRVARWFSGLLRRGQTGYVRTYAIVFLLGVVVLLAILLLPLLQASAAQ
jgi:NADH:ubiquinone oxidoreductase subunit 5 (subunit L)/multisubunit Na+/H+ antiporter MnhA subunit